MRLAFDIEANGFYNEVSRIHCLVIKDVDTGQGWKFDPTGIEEGLRILLQADLLIGHNVIGYDLPVIQKLYPWFNHDWAKVRDTLTLSRLIWSNLSDLDPRRRPQVYEALREKKRVGSHALEAWGIRLGYNKLDYQGGWDEYTEEMLEYCVVDVEVTERLWKLIEEKQVDPRASLNSHGVEEIIARQERYGFTFDEAKANLLTQTLMKRKAILEVKLQDTFKPFFIKDGKPVTPKRSMKRKGAEYTEGHPYQKIKLTMFNPGSTHHIAGRLKVLYGWEPTEFTPSGLPKVDDKVLAGLPWPEAKLLAEYFMVIKRLALVSEGEQSFTKYLRNGKCYGSLIVNGTVTGRGTHRVIANIPRVGTPYGEEMRELFKASPGRKQVGIDVSGLELRMLAHFLAAFDGGAYGKIVCEGDVHTANQLAAGLTTRNQAKTFIYAFLYGGGDEKIGSIAEPLAPSAKKRKLGKTLKAKFKEKTPGLTKLLEKLKKAAEAGFLKGLDGRKIRLRSDHSALNFLLQSAGSLVCMRWMIEVDLMIKERGWTDKVQQLIWYHDELQFETDPDIAEEFGQAAVACIPKAGEYFNIRVPLTGEYKVGSNWKECH